MNIVFAINKSYKNILSVLLFSILKNNPQEFIHFYILTTDFDDEDKKNFDFLKKSFSNFDITYLEPDITRFKHLKTNIDYITIETYYRYLIAELLPNEDRALYLDADMIVDGSLAELYNTDLAGYYLAGVRDAFIKHAKYLPNSSFKPDDLYINAGMLLCNLELMRQDDLAQKLISNTIQYFNKISYQDQDIINITCKDKIKEVSCIYNFASHNIKTDKDKIKQAIIIHYTGKVKAWNKDSKNKLNYIWIKYKKMVDKSQKKKIKVGLLIDEFFGGAGTAFGGYGFLARKYIAKYIPDENIQIDVLLGKGKKKFFATKYHVDDVDLYSLPKKHFAARLWLKKQNYDIYLSIELTTDYVLKHETNPHKKLILWIQDPRPKSAWENVINTMQSIKDPCFYHQQIYDAVNDWANKGRVKFISQGNTLTPLAMELYNLPATTPIQYLPNPVDIDFDFQFDLKKKKKQVIFLGRLEAQKRAWLFCEIAKRMPEYDFLVLGQFFRYQEDNRRMLAPYMNNDIPNLHFAGHVDGTAKKQLIAESRLLISTAIWEGIPISWLEALSYGTVLVSDLERENLAERFGIFVGDILGDGFDQVNKFIPAIKELMENDELYRQKAADAIQYIRETHNIQRFQTDLKEVIYKVVK